MIGFESISHLGLLGNQMFQYAALKGIATHRGYNYCLPQSKDKNYFRKNKFLQEKNKPDSKLDERNWDLQLLYPFSIKVRKGIVKGPTIHERFFHFDEQLFNNCPDKVNLSGFFQSYKYFEHIGADIRNDFSFTEEVKLSATTVVPWGAIALHIRRGTNPIFHPELDLQYYKHALKQFPSYQPVLIFTNDPKWVLKQRMFRDDRFYISFDQTNYADLYLMTQCSAHIIANSSFSWWGAWLSASKKVVAPKRFYNDFFNYATCKINHGDLYPKSWVTI